MFQVSQKQIEHTMKQMGIKQEKIVAEEVVIKTKGKQIIVKNPEIVKIDMMGQESLQITGDIQYIDERTENRESDIKLVMQQAKCSEQRAKEALEKTDWDLAKAILELQKS